MKARVAFVGPLPPPVHGFSNISGKMLDLLRAETCVAVFDRTPRPGGARAQLAQALKGAAYFFWCLRNRNAALFLELSGGWGQMIDLLYVSTAATLGQRIFVHHHSYAYLNRPTVYNRMALSLLRRQTHIVLSVGMGEILAARYRVAPGNLRVISNSAFYGTAEPRSDAGSDPALPIRLGFISNITFEKGFVEFFKVLQRLRELHVAFNATVAGPVEDGARRVFDELRSQVDVRYVGPVYGSDKETFYRGLDVLLFPSKYANEAEPLVVHEALRSGVFVIATDKGSIAEMLQGGAGIVIRPETFVEAAADHVEKLSVDRARLRQAQRCSQEQAHRARERSLSELQAVIDDVAAIAVEGRSVDSTT